MRQGTVVTLLAVVACLASGVAHAQPTPVAVEMLTSSGLTLQPQVEWERARLVVGGPDDYWAELTYSSPEVIGFQGLEDAAGPLQDGLYRYELSLFSDSERIAVRRGHLAVESGQMTRRGRRGEALSPEIDGSPSRRPDPISPRDFVDAGDIKAGGGLSSGDTSLNPLDGELQLEFLGNVSSLLSFTTGVSLGPLGSLWVQPNGQVGVGTILPFPNVSLHVAGGPGGNVAIVEGGALAIQRSDGISANIRFTADGQSWLFQNQPTDGSFNIRDQTGSVTPVRIFPGGQGATLVVRNGRLGLRNTAPQHPIHAFNGARLTSGGVWANASSRESKQEIERLSTEEALAALEALDPVKFAYKADATDRHVGFIAEDVPDLVASPDRKALAAMDVVAVLTKVVQEQQHIVEEQQAQIAEQRRQFEAELAELRELLVVQQAGAGGA